jgi:hypothetical protein
MFRSASASPPAGVVGIAQGWTYDGTSFAAPVPPVPPPPTADEVLAAKIAAGISITSDALTLAQCRTDATNLERRHRRAAKPLAIDMTCAMQPGHHPIADHSPFELPEDRQHPEQGTTGWRAGIGAC